MLFFLQHHNLGGRNSQINWVEMCGTLLKTLNIKTKICNFLCLFIHDLTRHLLLYLRPDPYVNTQFGPMFTKSL